jgi:hypothetical protein
MYGLCYDTLPRGICIGRLSIQHTKEIFTVIMIIDYEYGSAVGVWASDGSIRVLYDLGGTRPMNCSFWHCGL